MKALISPQYLVMRFAECRMSTNLYWEPVQRGLKALSDELKHAMKSQYGTPLSVRMNEADVLYLTGLLHAGITDAALLIEAIHQHGEIDVAEK